MKVIFLDDERFIESVNWVNYQLPENCTRVIVRTFLDFVREVTKIKTQEELDQTVFSFDHDLADFVPSGLIEKAKNELTFLQTGDYIDEELKVSSEELKKLRMHSVEEFIYAYYPNRYQIQNGNGTIEYSGKSCVEWLIDYVMDNDLKLTNRDNFYFHSQNPIGRKNMESKIENFIEFCQKNTDSQKISEPKLTP